MVDAIATTFIAGYNETLPQRDTTAATQHVQSESEEFLKPFYVEGAAMALAAANAVPGIKAKASLEDLLGALPAHKHVIYAGWGWWPALDPRRTRAARRAIDTTGLFSAITLDGMAFARAFLLSAPPHFDIAVPALSEAQKRVWVQGYGRALWFLCGADESVIARQQARVGEGLAAELDAGMGLAAGFAGIATDRPWRSIPSLAHRPAYLQGLAFGLTARASSTPEVFAEWLARLPPGESNHVEQLVARCHLEPSAIDAQPAVTYTHWQQTLRTEFAQTWTAAA